MDKMNIISSNKTWLEQSAVDQLKQVSNLPGVVRAVGLPDLHPGKTPVGAAIITEGIIYPHLIGNDIGCGMGLYSIGIEKRKAKFDRWQKKLEELKDLREIPLYEEFANVTPTLQNKEDIGTIGGGNHFAELQEFEEVLDFDHFHSLGLNKNHVMLLVHSGSRKLGADILDEFIREYKAQNGLPTDSEQGSLYMAKHQEAMEWAELNRDMIAYRILTAMGINPQAKRIINCVHNALTIKSIKASNLYIHRKGVAPADLGAVIIPGSRGTLSYLVMPTGDTSISGYSLAHGAGRKWERSACKAKLADKYTKETIKTTKLKGRVICHDNNLLFEEAPEAYKNINTVIQDLLEFGLIKVIATLKPVMTFKG